MCTRFFVEPDQEEFREIIQKAQRSRLKERFLQAGDPLYTSGEIRPSCVVPVIAPNTKGELGIFPMKWGFHLSGYPLIVNARSETAALKPTFRESWRKRRCIIPASWYFEWEHLKTPAGREKAGDKFAIQPKDSSLTFLCGIYRMEEGYPVFVVLTREPSEAVKRLHDRMPLILPKERIRQWIEANSSPESLFPYAVTDLIAERIS